jgi:ribosomal 50S subunit-associated protein YjgA (DUF615 family)
MDAIVRASVALEAVEASLAELREKDDPRNAELLHRLEQHRDDLAAELAKLAAVTEAERPTQSPEG